ncbi:MAG: transposase [Gammaproteobacteria bacterium]|nr:transposase [Gammaproteobacteria bacterium]NNM13959.1 transposase [Gammaproteobacteria bacterium]
MAISRRQLIDADTTPYYHIMSRCVRRAFLCGKDQLTGRDFSYRRQWIEDKLFELTQIFAIDVAAYAVMSNHYHLVLRIDTDLSNAWSMDEVFEQYSKLHGCTSVVERYQNGADLTPAEVVLLNEFAKEYRTRLSSISWFMKVMNQHIARLANKEDNCTGKFWESRFKSQALLDEAAVLTCMAYVDLNPIRAGMADRPELSDFTSIQTRLNRNKRVPDYSKSHLLDFVNHKAEYGDKSIPLAESAYIELVDWTGRCIREGKKGSIPANLAPILERINLSEQDWLRHTRFFEARFKRVAGTWESIKKAAKLFGKKWFQGKPSKPLPT